MHKGSTITFDSLCSATSKICTGVTQIVCGKANGNLLDESSECYFVSTTEEGRGVALPVSTRTLSPLTQNGVSAVATERERERGEGERGERERERERETQRETSMASHGAMRGVNAEMTDDDAVGMGGAVVGQSVGQDLFSEESGGGSGGSGGGSGGHNRKGESEGEPLRSLDAAGTAASAAMRAAMSAPSRVAHATSRDTVRIQHTTIMVGTSSNKKRNLHAPKSSFARYFKFTKGEARMLCYAVRSALCLTMLIVSFLSRYDGHIFY